MKKIVLIGEINNYDKPSGPGNVVKNLLIEFEKNNMNYIFINSYCDNLIKKILLFLKLFTLFFKRNLIINVHSFGYSVPLIVNFISKFNKKNKYFLTLHGVFSIEQKIEFGRDIDYKILKKEEKLISEFPNIICVSNYSKKYLDKNFKRNNNVYVVYNSIDLGKIKKIPKKLDNKVIRLISAGGISNRKSVLEMVNLILYLNKKNVNVSLEIYGGISNSRLYSEFNSIVSGINNIKYCGSINFDELLDKYYSSHFLLALTKFDTFNLTVLESMGQFTPAIVSNKAGVSELICHGKNGYVVDLETNYFSNIEKVLDTVFDDNYYNICNNANDLAKKFSSRQMFERYIEVFEINMKK